HIVRLRYGSKRRSTSSETVPPLVVSYCSCQEPIFLDLTKAVEPPDCSALINSKTAFLMSSGTFPGPPFSSGGAIPAVYVTSQRANPSAHHPDKFKIRRPLALYRLSSTVVDVSVSTTTGEPTILYLVISVGNPPSMISVTLF